MSVAKNLSLYGNGIDLRYAIKEYNPNSDVAPHDATAIGHTDKVYEIGFKNGTVSLNGVWKWDEVNFDEIGNLLRDVFDNDADIILTASRSALAVGGAADLSNCFVTKYSPPAQVGELIMVSADLQARRGIELGVWLFSSAVDDEDMTGTAVDNAAATANGGILHAHAQNVDLPTLDSNAGVTLQHSTDNSTWVDLIALTPFTEPEFGALSIEVAAGTTVRRYLRVIGTAIGGIANIQAAFARR
jgi:hypothetical protein